MAARAWNNTKAGKKLLILFIVSSTFAFFESPLKFEKFDLRNYAKRLTILNDRSMIR
jgi:hypothetical protein